MQAERSARQAVAFLDVTFSAPKSVTVMGVAFERAAAEAAARGDHERAAAWSMHAQAVEDAVLAGARAAIDYLQDVAGYSRVGHHGGGGGQWIDAHQFVVAQFRQHDSRDRDPQWHVHQAILNRVLCADGQWRALDSKAIHAARVAAGAIAERVMDARLARTVGARVEWRADGKAREVVGVDRDVLDLFSSRTRAIEPRVAQLVAGFNTRFGRPPSPYERAVIAQQVTLATRRAKSHDGETQEQQLDRWAAMAAARVAGGLAPIAQEVLARGQDAGPAAEFSPLDVVERAVAMVGENRQHYTRFDLLKAVNDALPAQLGIAEEEVLPLLEGLTAAAEDLAVRLTPQPDDTDLPDELRLANGQSALGRPGSARYATAGQLAAEHALRQAAVLRGATRLSERDAEAVLDRYAANGRPLGVDQATALRGVLTSGAQVEVLCAAPGTGKSFVVAALADAWTGAGPGTEPGAGPGSSRRVFGLAPSEVAAAVLAEEGLSATANTTAWLAAQRRLDDARPGTDGQDAAWGLRAGDLVVVDEANMTGTDQLAEIYRRCAAAGAKLLLVGDPRQLAAVGPGGALADIAEHGLSYELADVRRFHAQWERTASLRLHDGDADVLAEYDKHGRLRDGGTAEQTEAAAARAWLADTLTGRESLLMVGTNAAAARLSAALRAELVTLGRVEQTGVALRQEGWQGVVAGVGDLVLARRNGWELLGFAGNTRAPLNAASYRVTALREDGGLTVAPVLSRSTDPSRPGEEELGAPLQLSPGYVGADLTLAYASTVYAAEGRTVDTAHTVTGGATDLAGLLVPMTRGREANTAWVITRNLAPDAQTGETFDVDQRTPRAVLADVMDNAELERSALAERERAEVEARSTMTHVDQLVAVAAHTTTGRLSAAFDRLTAAGHLTPDQRTALAADDTRWSLERLLRTAELAGHRPEHVLEEAVAARDLTGAGSIAQVLHHRITTRYAGRLTPHLTSAADLVPTDAPDTHRAWFSARAAAADARRAELGADAAHEAPAWAVQALGPVPALDDLSARADWEQRAGWAAAWRELSGHDADGTADSADPLGAAPPRGLVEKAALFRAAHEALRLVDIGAEEADMTDGQLRVRVTAHEREDACAPRYVADELAATHEAAHTARNDATVWRARAQAPDVNDADRAQLRAAAEQAARRADELEMQAAQLDYADQARSTFLVHSAVSRDLGERAAAELRARGVDPHDTSDRVTAAEWLAAHRAATATEDAEREIQHDYELTDSREYESDHHDRLRADDTTAHGNDQARDDGDVRGRLAPNPPEGADRAQRRRVLPPDETAAAVARAQDVLATVTARQRADAERAARDTDETARAEELARWADHTASDGRGVVDAADHSAGWNVGDEDGWDDTEVVDRAP